MSPELGPEPRSNSGAFSAHDGDHPLTVGGIVKVLSLVTFVGGIVATAAVGHYRIGQLEKESVEQKVEIKQLREGQSPTALRLQAVEIALANQQKAFEDLRREVSRIASPRPRREGGSP